MICIVACGDLIIAFHYHMSTEYLYINISMRLWKKKNAKEVYSLDSIMKSLSLS